MVNGFGRRSFYIADFYCVELKLVIEVDGPIHLQKKDYDANRDLVMQGLGLTILRFTNDEVSKDVKSVVGKIAEYL
ncbi:endonuclease domain-containing protein [Mucilaginibacter lutimaris]|uniref:Endonuclease domain-containing protein n=1 Tax=Mucilaginibacter lutimaris TaxID=931629 RepID=A0ABW2ZKV2_9SPHI